MSEIWQLLYITEFITLVTKESAGSKLLQTHGASISLHPCNYMCIVDPTMGQCLALFGNVYVWLFNRTSVLFKFKYSLCSPFPCLSSCYLIYYTRYNVTEVNCTILLWDFKNMHWKRLPGLTSCYSNVFQQQQNKYLVLEPC